jgi:hypothetical protein
LQTYPILEGTNVVAQGQGLTTTAATWHMKPKSEKRISPAAAMMQPEAVRATIASRNVL